ELWGVLLLVPWSIFGIDLLLHLTGLGAGPALAYDTDVIALVAIYGVNTVAFVVEYASYRRRMRDLRLEHPELAAAYGLRPCAPTPLPPRRRVRPRPAATGWSPWPRCCGRCWACSRSASCRPACPPPRSRSGARRSPRPCSWRTRRAHAPCG